MPSKGFQLYTYIAIPGIQVKYSVPGAALTRSQSKKFFNDHLEVEKDNLPPSSPFNFVGRFQFDVRHNGKVILTKWCDVNILTGNIVRDDGLREMEDQVSHVTSDVIVTYGMYDAARVSVAGLPYSNQVWVTVHENQSGWMGTLAPEGTEQASLPFTKLVLPSAHNVGMNSMQNAEAILNKIGRPLLTMLKAVNPIAKSLATLATDDVLLAQGPNIVRGLAITQKDSLADMLAIGTRYFEFRPAHLLRTLVPAAPILDRLYFHHGPVPGMSFEQFLHDCVEFLVANPTEIIVVQLRWDGVPPECARPGDLEVAQYLADALEVAANGLIVGTLDDMQRLSIAKLREQRKRLILFTLASQYSSWNEKSNATLDGASIVSEFDRMTAKQQAGKALTLLQCQATPTEFPDVACYSVLTANVSNSCLLAAKGICDQNTLSWIRTRALNALTAEQLLVIMCQAHPQHHRVLNTNILARNDFIDGATVDTAIELSKKRLTTP